ncbi:hypothetical protein FRB97_002137, partial [Tulasnella sp. 331]
DGEELRADIGDRDNCLARLVTENVERTEPLGYIAAARNTTVNKIAAARKTTSIQCAERDFQARKVLQLEDKMWMLQVQLDFAVNRHIGCTQLKDQAACIDLCKKVEEAQRVTTELSKIRTQPAAKSREEGEEMAEAPQDWCAPPEDEDDTCHKSIDHAGP